MRFALSDSVLSRIFFGFFSVMASAFFVPALAQTNPSPCPTSSETVIKNSGINNFCVVVDGKLWRGAKPDTVGAAWLIDNGVKAVVNLELLNDDLPTLINAKPQEQTQAELKYYRVRDWEPLVVVAPRLVDKHVVEFLAITLAQPGPIYVHCRSGQNRTGIMVAAYRVIIDGMAIADAITELGSYQGIWFKSDAQYIRSLTPSRREALLVKARAMAKLVKARATVRCAKAQCA
jgi:Dual specificity phosphatase, catalytic domain